MGNEYYQYNNLGARQVGMKLVKILSACPFNQRASVQSVFEFGQQIFVRIQIRITKNEYL